MRIIIDIDGTICETKKPGQTYDQLRVNPGAGEKIKALKDAGHYIILHSSRHMKTTGGDVKMVIEKVGAITEAWLKDNGIVYDELHFGKPYNHIVIDDRGFVFEGWEHFDADGFNDQQINIVISLVEGKGKFDGLQALIPILGKTVVEWVVESFQEVSAQTKTRLLFVVLEEHVVKYAIDKKLKDLFGNDIGIVPIPHSQNELAHILAAGKHINNLQKLIITSTNGISVAPLQEILQESNLVGVIPVRDGGGEGNFVKNDKWGYVEQADTHKKIADFSATGVYYFNAGRDFVSSAKTALLQDEFGIISCYNELIKRGQNIKAVPATEYWRLDTPDGVQHFEQHGSR